jgi:predicted dehydrogenase
VQAAVFGCGQQGQLHIAALSRLPGISLQAICDSHGPTLQRVRAQYEVAFAYEDYRQLLSQHEIDLAAVCTMPDSHCEIVTAALAAGAHVLCEKPFALDRHEAAAMLRASLQAQRVITVGFNLRFTTSAQQIEKLVAAGRIGRPTYARLWSRSGFPGWGRHHVTAVSGGGVLAGSAVHGIDLVRWLAGRPRPTSVSAFLIRDLPASELEEASFTRPVDWDCENSVCAVVRFDGFSLLLDAEWAAGVTSVKHELELVGEQGRIRFVPFFSGPDEAAVPFDKGPGSTVDFVPDRSLSSSVYREWEAWVEAQRSGTAPAVSAADAFTVQAIVDAIYESARTQREVDVDLSELPAAFLDSNYA